MTFDAHPRSSLIVALDFDSLSSALKFAERVSDLVGMFKIGNQLFTSAGPEAVKQVAALGNGIFLDLKFHDIPNTVAGAVLSAAAMPGVQLVNVHALGGAAMLQAATQAVSAGVPMGADRTRLIAVTILTSMDHKTMREAGIAGTPITSAVKLAKLAKKCGVDGVVASVQEAKAIRKAEKSQDDQVRTATPTQAIKAGADYMVVGRPIIAANDPRAAAQSIVDEIASAK